MISKETFRIFLAQETCQKPNNDRNNHCYFDSPRYCDLFWFSAFFFYLLTLNLSDGGANQIGVSHADY